jgi:hypothetical protein
MLYFYLLFRIAHNNLLTGNIPTSIYNLFKLQYVSILIRIGYKKSLILIILIFRYLYNNQLEGTISSAIGDFAQMIDMYYIFYPL